MSKKNIKKRISEPSHTPQGLVHQGSYSQEDYQEINTFLSRLELGDLCFSDVIEYAIALFGQTKAGKTTLAHYLVHNPLVVQMQQSEDRPAYALDSTHKTNKLSQAIIGMTHQSQTVIPNSCEVEQIKEDNKKVVLLDCPGYSDSKGSFLIITNAYFHYRIFSKVKNLKFILTIDANYLTETYQRAVCAFQHFFKSFKNFNLIKDQIFAATVLIFTKTSERVAKSIEQRLETLKKKAAQKMRDYSKEDSILVADMINNIIQNKRYYCFKQAEAQNIDKKIIGNDLLKTINNNTKFWSRPLSQDPNEVDMRYIRFAVGKQISSNLTNKFKDQFATLCGISAQRFQQAFLHGTKMNKLSLSNILLSFMNNSLTGNPEEKQFATKYINEARKKFYIYGQLKEQKQSKARQYNKKRQKVKYDIQNFPENAQTEKYKVEWIQKIQISKILIDLLQKNADIIQSKEKRTLKFFSTKSVEILKILSLFKKINFYRPKSIQQINYQSLMNDYCYIIYRLLEEAKVFKIIFYGNQCDTNKEEEGTNEYYLSYTDKTIILSDMLTQLIDQTMEISHHIDPNIIEKAKINYVCDFLIIKQNQSLNYYKQIQKYCKEIDPIFHNEKFKQVLTEISKAKLSSKNVDLDKNQTIISIISRIRNIKSIMKSSNSIKNQQLYTDDMNQLAAVLIKGHSKELDSPNKQKANFSSSPKVQAQSHLKWAIKIYQIINNVYMAIEAYKILKTKYSEEKQSFQLKQMLLQFADYAANHGRKQLAIENFQHAYHLIDIIYKQLRQDYEVKRIQRDRIAQKIGFTGIEKRHDPSEKYYDQMLTKKYATLITQKQLNMLEQELALK